MTRTSRETTEIHLQKGQTIIVGGSTRDFELLFFSGQLS